MKIKKEKFINDLKDALEIEDEIDIRMDTNLKNLEVYDSLSVLVIVAMVGKIFGKQISSSDFKNITTIRNLIELIGMDYFE
jgi:acyl carrier protein